MNRIDRLFGILTLLQSRRYVTADKIAEKFGISVRTVYRDVKAIGEQGVPVSFESGKGYFIVQGYFLPPVSFTLDEVAAMLLTENMVNAFSDKSIQKNYSNALNKVRTVMSESQKERLQILSDSTRTQYPDRLRNDFEYMIILQNAITFKLRIEIGYKNMKEEESKRILEPIGLIFYAFSWHLIAWCELRKDYRDFKVPRIIHIRELEVPFKNQTHMGIGEYMKELPVDY